MAADLLEALYPGLYSLPEYLSELRQAVESLRVPPPDDDGPLLAVLAALQRSVDNLTAVQAVEAAEPVTTERWDEVLEEMRILSRKATKSGVAGVSVGFPDDFKNQLLALFQGTPAAQVGTLTSRMLAKQPLATKRLWFDTVNASYIYTAEAPFAEASGDGAVFNGIRVTKDATGNPLGKVEELSGFAWNNRVAAVGWT